MFETFTELFLVNVLENVMFRQQSAYETSKNHLRLP